MDLCESNKEINICHMGIPEIEERENWMKRILEDKDSILKTEGEKQLIITKNPQ